MQPNNAASGYLQSKKSTGTPRAIEYQVFMKVTAKLRTANEPNAAFTTVAEAVHQNNQLWTTLMIDLFDERNQLPDDLRANLVGLAEFSRRHGSLVLSGNETVEPLIDVNTAVMRGLRGVAGASETVEG